MNKPAAKAIKAFSPGDVITSFFLIRKIELKTKKNGEPYLIMEFGDHSGRISSTFWDDPIALHEQYQISDIVKTKGTVTQYKDILQLSVDKIRKADPEDNINRSDFLPKIEPISPDLDHSVFNIW